MIPHLLISQNQKIVDKYIKSLINNYHFTHDQIYTIKKDKTMIKIDQIRDINSYTNRKDNQYKVIIIRDFETSRSDTQNSLLKILEEKSAQIFFILISSNESVVLPTVLSRVKTVTIDNEFNISTKKNSILIEINNDPKVSLLKTNKISKENAIAEIDNAIYYFKESNYNDNGNTLDFVKVMLKIRKLLILNNINPERAIDYLLLYRYIQLNH